jgi:hypothetical protein
MIHRVLVLAAIILSLSVWAQSNNLKTSYMLRASDNRLWHAQESSPASGCTRASLQSSVDSYIEALESANPSSMSLTPQVNCIENQKESAIW